MPRERGRGRLSIVDVARVAGVSPATAGRVLGGYGYASDTISERVRGAADALGYRPNLLARGLITGRTQTLGVVAADLASPFYASVIRGIADAAQAAGFGVLVTNSDEAPAREQDAVRLLLEKQVDGLIVAPSDPGAAPHLAAALAGGCKVVQIDRVARGLAADSVTVDNVGAARACVRRLIEAGHRRIGFVAELPASTRIDVAGLLRRKTPLPLSSGLAPSWFRLSGYVLACRDAGLDVDAALIGRAGVYSAEMAYAAARGLLSRTEKVTALFTADGLMSIGAMQAVVSLSLGVPRDVSLVCFDDLDWMQFVGGGITAASQPARAVGTEAVALMLRRIAGDTEPARHVVVPVPITDRHSILRR